MEFPHFSRVRSPYSRNQGNPNRIRGRIALAQRFLKRSANLALIARDANKLATVKAMLAVTCGTGQKIEIFPCDVSDYASMEKTMNNIADTLGLPDILINSAGILREGYFENLSLTTLYRRVN